MPDTPTTQSGLRAWQWRIFWLLWGAYAAYYLCRVNFAVAQPLLLKAFPDWTNAKVGSIPSVYAVFYAVGHLLRRRHRLAQGSHQGQLVADVLRAGRPGARLGLPYDFHLECQTETCQITGQCRQRVAGHRRSFNHPAGAMKPAAVSNA